MHSPVSRLTTFPVATGFTAVGTLVPSTMLPASLSNIILPAIALPTTRLMLNLRSSQGSPPAATAMPRNALHRINPLGHTRRAGDAMGMSCVYEVRGGVRVKEAGRTTFVEVEMDITESEGAQRPHTGVGIWSTTGKWEDVAIAAPAFASPVRPSAEEAPWVDMGSTPSLRTADRIPSPRTAHLYDIGVYEHPATTPTASSGMITYPRNTHGLVHVVSRTASEVTDVSGGTTAVGSGSTSPTPGERGHNHAREGSRTINWSLPTHLDRHRQHP